MTMRFRTIVAALALLFGTTVVAGDIKVMTSGAFTAPYLELSPRFEREAGEKLITLTTTMGVGAASIPNRIAAGEPVDVIIVASASLDELIRDGRVVADSKVDLARSDIGMAVRAGAPKPDISTVEAFTRTLLQATSIAYSASVSGDYLVSELVQRLGVADQVLPKSRRVVGERVGAVVARGEAEIGFQQISELLPVPGVDYVGPLPAEIQRTTIFSAGVATKAENPAAARAFIHFLASAANAGVVRKSGLEPIMQAPVPLEPVAAILDVFKDHPIVALSEPHSIEQAYELRLKLIRDPRFAALVNDVVVETGNARYQDVVDRFIRGDEVPDAELRRVWQDIVTPGPSGDLPIYEGFYRAVRDVNATLPRERRLRVLLADPPIDWSAVRNADDLVKWGLERDVHAAEVITREVIAKKRRALLVFGEAHLRRRNPRSNFEADDWPGPFVGILSRAGHRVFTISSAPVNIIDLSTLIDVQGWPAPSFALLRGTTLGSGDSAAFMTPDARYLMRGGKRIDIPREQWRVIPLEEQFDALLYLGPRASLTRSRLPAALCADQNYLKMRLARMAIVGQPPDVLKAVCAAAPPG